MVGRVTGGRFVTDSKKHADGRTKKLKGAPSHADGRTEELQGAQSHADGQMAQTHADCNT